MGTEKPVNAEDAKNFARVAEKNQRDERYSAISPGD